MGRLAAPVGAVMGVNDSGPHNADDEKRDGRGAGEGLVESLSGGRERERHGAGAEPDAPIASFLVFSSLSTASFAAASVRLTVGGATSRKSGSQPPPTPPTSAVDPAGEEGEAAGEPPEATVVVVLGLVGMEEEVGEDDTAAVGEGWERSSGPTPSAGASTWGWPGPASSSSSSSAVVVVVVGAIGCVKGARRGKTSVSPFVTPDGPPLALEVLVLLPTLPLG